MAKARLKLVSNEENPAANANDAAPVKAERKKRTPKVVEAAKPEAAPQEVAKPEEPKAEVSKPEQPKVEQKSAETEKTIRKGPTSANNILSAIMAFKTMYVLCTLNKKTGRLTATHYAICLVNGRNPTWGVFTIAGKLQRLRNSKEEVARDYPRLTWRKKMSEFRLENTFDLDVNKRRQLIEGLVEA